MQEITIPAEYAGLFYAEAVKTLQYAASNLEEGADWFAEGKGGDGHGDRLEAEDIPRMKAAIELIESTDRDAELEFGADELVRTTLEGLVLNSADGVKDRAEGMSTDATREAMAELEGWLALLDSEAMQEVMRQRAAEREARRLAEGRAP